MNTDPKVLGDHTIRAAWEDSRDSSTVWGKVNPGRDTLASGYDRWTSGRPGRRRPTQRDHLHSALEHTWRRAPSTGCTSLADLGNMTFVLYTTDYYFYKSTGGGKEDGNDQ